MRRAVDPGNWTPATQNCSGYFQFIILVGKPQPFFIALPFYCLVLLPRRLQQSQDLQRKFNFKHSTIYCLSFNLRKRKPDPKNSHVLAEYLARVLSTFALEYKSQPSTRGCEYEYPKSGTRVLHH